MWGLTHFWRGGGRTRPPRFGFMCDISFFMLLARYSGSFAESVGPDPLLMSLVGPLHLTLLQGVVPDPPPNRSTPNTISSQSTLSSVLSHTAEPLHSELTC